MRTLILFARRNVGVNALAFLIAKGYKVKVISDDENVIWLAKTLGCELVTLDTMGAFDLFLCVHGNRIIDKKYLVEGRFVNVHPMLHKYRGMNPIKRYIENKDTEGVVQSHYMEETVDTGKIICAVRFETPVCNHPSDFYNVAFAAYYVCINRTIKLILGN